MNLKRFIYKVLDRKRFTLAKYEEFLQSISRYKVLPLNEFRNYHNDNEVVIGLRHDVDSDFEATKRMCMIEFANEIRSTVFVLHTAKYFNDPTFIQDLQELQRGNFEIGLHQDCMKYFNAPSIFRRAVAYLRESGINVVGTSAHGDKAHENIDFWKGLNKADFGIKYEAYELDHNKYYSDCTFIDGHRWHPEDLPEFKVGMRVQILIHPEHHHK